MKKLIVVFFFGLMLSGCSLPLSTNLNQQATQTAVTIDQDMLDSIKAQILSELQTELQNQTSLTDVEQQIIAVASTEGQSVLGVSNYEKINGKLAIYATGSGIVYKDVNGTYYLVTNNHVVDGADAVKVVLSDGTSINATVIGTDAESDLAVLTFTSSEYFEPVQFADSDNLRVGQFAIAIGNPLGYDYYGSVSLGIVSGLARNVPVDYNEDGITDWTATLIQHDAAINPGNSGGGLFDITGKLIGINNMKIVETDVNGIGFAIPSNTIQAIITQLENNGSVTRPKLGITGMGVQDALQLSTPPTLPNGVTTGVYVDSIVAGGSADGYLQAGDVIVKYNDTDILTFDNLRLAINSSFVGDSVTLQVNRDGSIINVTFDLKASVN